MNGRRVIKIGFVAVRAVGSIVAVSRHTKTDIVSLLQCPESRVHVAYPAVSPLFKPLRDMEDLAATRKRLSLPERFALFVGTLEPRKNLERLIRAFYRVKADPGLALLVVGARGWKYAPIFECVHSLDMTERVVFPGYVTDRDLVQLYNLAEAFVYPSLYEGFGFPLLEAMACGCPAVSSTSSSLPEVAGDAALLVDPADAETFASTLDRLLGEESLRRDLAARGRKRAASFSGKAFADAMLDLYHSNAERAAS